MQRSRHALRMQWDDPPAAILGQYQFRMFGRKQIDDLDCFLVFAKKVLLPDPVPPAIHFRCFRQPADCLLAASAPFSSKTRQKRPASTSANHARDHRTVDASDRMPLSSKALHISISSCAVRKLPQPFEQVALDRCANAPLNGSQALTLVVHVHSALSKYLAHVKSRHMLTVQRDSQYFFAEPGRHIA